MNSATPTPSGARRPARRWRRHDLALAAALLLGAPAWAVQPTGVTVSWVSAAGNWSNFFNWLDYSAPATGDSVIMYASDATIYYTDSAHAELDKLSLVSSQINFQQSGNSTLSSNQESLDTAASAFDRVTHDQSGGTNITGYLSIGGLGPGIASYQISGTAQLAVSDRLFVGTQLGLGSGNGFFTQSDSSSVSAGSLVIEASQALRPALYTLSGGTLVTGGASVGMPLPVPFGDAGSAMFMQTGGVHTTGTLTTASTGTYLLQGGRLNLTNYVELLGDSGGTFDWQGGTLHVNNTLSIGDGSLPFNKDSRFTIGAGRTLGATNLIVSEGKSLVHGGGQLLIDSADTFTNLGTHDIGSSVVSVDGIALNQGVATMAGGSIVGNNGTYTNQGVFSGWGRVGGAVNVSNEGQWLVSGGTLAVASSQRMQNFGTLSFAALTDKLDLAPNYTSTGLDVTFVNQGLLLLSGQQVTGYGLLTNSYAGMVSGTGTVRTPFENDGGVVVPSGSLNFTRSFTNSGTVQLGSAAARLGGGGIFNQGRLQGLGTVTAPVNNARSGTIEAQGGTLVFATYMADNLGVLSAATGTQLQLPGGLGSNDGSIVLAGGTVSIQSTLSNTGSVSGFGRLEAGDITNSGRLQLTGGSVLVQATNGLANGLHGQIIVSGNANASFLGKVNLNAGSELRVSDGAVATFFGYVQAQQGAIFSGAGTTHFEGGFSSTNVAQLRNQGSVVLGGGNVYVAELAGGSAGAQADELLVDGNLSLGGTLKLVELADWQPQAGMQFALFSAGALSGGFSAIDTSAASLASGLVWDFSQLATSGQISITAVPEPGTWALWLAGAVLVASRRRMGISNGA